jgi:DNA-directed RNA polymerase subunit RPC12/RpoP
MASQLHSLGRMSHPAHANMCPQCGSERLTFVDHLQTVSVYRCDDCGRAIAWRWGPLQDDRSDDSAGPFRPKNDV